MKEDNLEKFIANHRKEFDTAEPPPMVWMNLEKELESNNTKEKKSGYVHELKWPSMMRMMSVAAMFLVVMGVGLLIGLQINKGDEGYNNPRLNEFVEAERHYNKKIDDMWTVVKTTGTEEETSIAEDLKALDEVYNELKEELLNGTQDNTNEVVNAMIKNYRTKIEILETVLNKQNQQLKLEDEKIKI